MDYAWLLLLRLLHVVGGVMWVGGVAMLAWFVLPTVALEGAHGGRFVQRMVTERRLSAWLGVVAGLTVLSGLVLYTRATLGTHGAFARSHAGMTFGLGGALALVSMVIGGAMGGASARKLGVIRQRLAAEGRAPTAEEGAEIGRLAAQGARSARITAVLLLIVTVTMAIGRYA